MLSGSLNEVTIPPVPRHIKIYYVLLVFLTLYLILLLLLVQSPVSLCRLISEGTYSEINIYDQYCSTEGRVPSLCHRFLTVPFLAKVLMKNVDKIS